MKIFVQALMVLLPFGALSQCFIDSTLNTFQTYHIGGVAAGVNEYFDDSFTVYFPYGSVQHPELGITGSAIIEVVGIFDIAGIPEGLEYEFYLDDGTLVDTTGMADPIGVLGEGVSEIYPVPSIPGYLRLCIHLYGTPTEVTVESNFISVGFYAAGSTVPYPLGATFSYRIDFVVTQDIYTPEICAVNTDPQTGYNQVVWNKLQSNFTDSFKIYSSLGSGSNLLELMGSMAYEELSVFVDTLNDPQNGPVNYFLTMVNTNGIESNQSGRHTTMHLDVDSATFNNELRMLLQWTEYYPYLNAGEHYLIYSGPSPSQLSVQTSISGFTATFLPYANTLTYYAVGTEFDAYCIPSKTSSGEQVFSNVVSNANILNVENIELGRLVFYPNPATSVITIQLPGNNLNAIQARIYDISGSLVHQQHFNPNMDIGHLSNGTYMVVVETEEGSFRGTLQKF